MPLTPEQEALKRWAKLTPPENWTMDDIDRRRRIYTYDANTKFIEAASPAAILAILAQVEAAPAPSEAKPDFSKFATLEEYKAALHAFDERLVRVKGPK